MNKVDEETLTNYIKASQLNDFTDILTGVMKFSDEMLSYERMLITKQLKGFPNNETELRRQSKPLQEWYEKHGRKLTLPLSEIGNEPLPAVFIEVKKELEKSTLKCKTFFFNAFIQSHLLLLSRDLKLIFERFNYTTEIEPDEYMIHLAISKIMEYCKILDMKDTFIDKFPKSAPGEHEDLTYEEAKALDFLVVRTNQALEELPTFLSIIKNVPSQMNAH